MSIATITHGDRVFRFRTNPNSIRWHYTLNTKVEETYGGRVIQLLSAKVEDLTVTAEAGLGGWDEVYRVASFFRDLVVDQRSWSPAIFHYPPRNYRLKVYATALPFKDQWDAVAREFTMAFKIQEDINDVMSSATLSSEMAKLVDGIQFRRMEGYNYSEGDESPEAEPQGQYDRPAGPISPIIPRVGEDGFLENPSAIRPWLTGG